MAIDGVLFDFSGTLFRLEPDGSWFDGSIGDPGMIMDSAGQDRLLRALIAPTGPGAGLPAGLQRAWERRDLEPELHRLVYVEIMCGAGVSTSHAEHVYELMLDPAHWRPYPDTEVVLRGLRDRGVKVAVVSNIAWDIRASFDRLGVADLVDAYVLSYVENAAKPDLRLFRTACDRLGLPAGRTLMIGDSEEADGAAAALGCDFQLVEPAPVADRPDALLRALRERGLLDETVVG
ncbi:HAD family hydrolase [Actinoalloteichus caeruleus]|uniref:HAD family hydrolase n=1 Tax=Actinoalloteichus cyanogriseus TaxID=2893586 RepID=UPI003BB8A09E